MGKLKDYKEDLELIQAKAREAGVNLDFFQGMWTSLEVAYFLRLSYNSVINHKAGLESIPCMRIGKKVLYRPDDVIAFREKLHREAKARTPRAHLTRLRGEERFD
jgi:hypothetical protein